MTTAAHQSYWRSGGCPPSAAALRMTLFLALLATMPATSRGAPAHASPATLVPSPSGLLPVSPARPTFFILSAMTSGIDGRGTLVASSTLSRDREAVSAALTAEPFGLAAFRAPESVIWTRWRTVRDRMASEAAAVEHCHAAGDVCLPAGRIFLDIVNAVAKRPFGQRLKAVNKAVNAAVRYVSDRDRHGTDDHWSSALETLAAGEGDCEDYAIAKYAVLRGAGFPEDRLQILLVRDRAVGLDHAVLAARSSDRWYFLDNRWDTVLDEAGAARFEPLFGLGGDVVRLFATPYIRQITPIRGPNAVLPRTVERVLSRNQQ